LLSVFIVAFQSGGGKSEIEVVGTNVIQNGSGEKGATGAWGGGGRVSLRANLVANLGGADLDVQAGKEVEGGLQAGRIAEDEAAEGRARLRIWSRIWEALMSICRPGSR